MPAAVANNNTVMGGVLGGSLRAAGIGIFGVNNLHLGIRHSLRLSLLSAEQAASFSLASKPSNETMRDDLQKSPFDQRNSLTDHQIFLQDDEEELLAASPSLSKDHRPWDI